MAEQDSDDADAVERLERALARIEARVEQPDPVQAEIAARLDAVIARLRAELEG